MKKIVFLALILSVQGCKDFLNREPVDQISVNFQMSTKQGVLQALNGVYADFRATNLSGSGLIYADLMGGNLIFRPSPNGSTTVSSFYNGIYDFNDKADSSEYAIFYTNNYGIINNLNYILQYADSIPDASAEEKNEIKAEALALRALTHFYLYRLYGQNYSYTADASHLGIVYNTKVLKVGEDYPARNTAREVFAHLYSDMETALPLFGERQAIPFGVKNNFMNKAAAQALFAEIALWREDYEKAAALCSEVIATSGVTLAPPTEIQNEVLFQIENNSENHNYEHETFGFTSATVLSLVSASKDVTDLYSSNDRRLQLFEIQNLATKEGNATVKIPYYFSRKFKDNAVKNLVSRLSEVYYIRAESYLKSGKTAAALADLNTMRSRAGLSSLATTSDLLNEILLDKRREMIYENEYFFDLVRNHRGVQRNSGCISAKCSMPYPSEKFVLPIPQATIDVNSNMKQNPGY